MPDRIRLSEISSRAWEHPADRAALNTLRALPGFDEVVRKVAGFLGERGVRQLFLANAVRVGGKQRPDLDRVYTEVLETLDAPTRWDLYVSQTPIANAFAVGFDKPFIVLNSGMLGLLDREGRRDVVAHEVGHIMSGHATYTTLALILIAVGLRNLPLFTGLALLPLELALLEWYRKAEFSADRAGLLGTQDVDASMEVFLRLAGGGGGDDQIDLETFMAQAAEYEGEPSVVDKIWQMLNTAFKTHPFATVRAAELQRWVKSGEYERILGGDYPRRGQEPPPLSTDYAEAANYYGQQARDVVSAIRTGFDRARQAFDQGYRGTSGPSGNGGTGGTTGTGGTNPA